MTSGWRSRDKAIFGGPLQHTHFLRSALALAFDRHEQLNRTLRRFGHSEMPTEEEACREVQLEAAREIGGIRAMLLLDGPQEIMKVTQCRTTRRIWRPTLRTS